jgi:phospholipid/cholesterol/gamma-HCH transport system substrate-binding protein
MKKEPGKKIVLGIFVSLGFVLFIASIYFIGQKQHLFSRTFHLSSSFKDVSGLQAGNNVRFSGINLGTIESVSIVNDSSAKVVMVLDESVRRFIRKDAVATIGSEGLMGNKIIVLSSGNPSAKEVKDNDVLVGTMPISMDDILGKLKVTVDNAADITTYLADIMDNIHSGRGTIGKLFMDTTFAENIDKTLVNLRQGTKGFSQNMDAAKHSFLLKRFLKEKKKDKESN